MKTITISIDESIYDTLMSFIDTLPKEKINILNKIDDNHIPFMSEEEEKEISDILKEEDTKIIVKSKTIRI